MGALWVPPSFFRSAAPAGAPCPATRPPPVPAHGMWLRRLSLPQPPNWVLPSFPEAGVMRTQAVQESRGICLLPNAMPRPRQCLPSGPGRVWNPGWNPARPQPLPGGSRAVLGRSFLRSILPPSPWILHYTGFALSCWLPGCVRLQLLQDHISSHFHTIILNGQDNVEILI